VDDGLRIEVDDLSRPAVRALLAEHLAEMRATSPPESVHALDLAELSTPRMTVWTLWEGEHVLGCAALAILSTAEGEIKSMRTTATVMATAINYIAGTANSLNPSARMGPGRWEGVSLYINVISEAKPSRQPL